MLNTQRRDAPRCATWGRKRGSSYMQCFPERFSPTHGSSFMQFFLKDFLPHVFCDRDIILNLSYLQKGGMLLWLLVLLVHLWALVSTCGLWPRWHVAMTASAPSAQGSVRDPLFFPHCLEVSANLVQTYFLTSSGSGRKYGLYSQLILMQQ